jgi:integral membrane protein
MDTGASSADSQTERTTALHRSLLRYRVMAYITGVLLIVLVFVGVPLQVAGHPDVVRVVGPLHGFMYIVYLFTAFDLTWRLRVPIVRTILVLLAGTVPFCSFIAERILTTTVRNFVPSTADDPRPEE